MLRQNKQKNSALAGFSLVEMVVVAGIIGIFASFMISSFSRTRLNYDETVNLFIGDLRIAQAKTVSSVQYSGSNRCGYGITYLGSNHYGVYVGPAAGAVDCNTINHNYQAGEDTIIKDRVFPDSRVSFSSSFSDIFFQPPDPKTYINNDSSLNKAPLSISIIKIGGSCPADCKIIKVYTSGKIETQ